MKNYDIPGMVYVGTNREPGVLGGCEIPVYEPRFSADGKPDINTREGWNAGAIESARRCRLRDPSVEEFLARKLAGTVGEDVRALCDPSELWKGMYPTISKKFPQEKWGAAWCFIVTLCDLNREAANEN